jgi:hypothetical protein
MRRLNGILMFCSIEEEEVREGRRRKREEVKSCREV